MPRGTSSTETGQGGGGSKREIREGSSRRTARASREGGREKRGFKDTKINHVSVSCCQEAGTMRTENFLGLSNNWRFWQERCQWEEGDILVDCLFSVCFKERKETVTAIVRRWETPPQMNWKTIIFFCAIFYFSEW